MVRQLFGDHKLRLWVALAGCGCAVAGFGARSSAASPLSCPKTVVIDIHGSGSAAGTASLPGAKLTTTLQKLQPQADIVLAPSPLKAEGGFGVLAGAVLKLPLAYHQSVVKAKNWLRSRLKSLAAKCSETKIFLTGYSQGAQAVGDVYQEQAWPQVTGVVLFGDPSFNGHDISSQGDFRQWRRGILHIRQPFNSPIVVSFCHQKDPVCQGASQLMHRFVFHDNYDKLGEPEAAARYLTNWGEIFNLKPAPQPLNKWPTKRNDGTTVFSMWVGANLMVLPDWSSCDPSYCIVGASDTVYVISLINGFDQIPSVPINATSPRTELSKRGVPDQDIEKLLSP